MQSKKSYIMVIDDHPIIHDGLKTLFAVEEDLEISMNAMSAGDAIKQLEQNPHPDIVIIDLSLDDSDGTDLVQRISKMFPKLLLLVYSMAEEKLYAERTALVGARGFVCKSAPPAALKEAIHTVLSGDLYFSEEILARLNKKYNGRGSKPKSIIDNLSNREMDIFKLIGEGLDTIQIGQKLGISRNTVDTHRINIKNKLELPNGKAVDRMAFEVIQQGKMPK